MGSYLIRYREDHLKCMQTAKKVIREVNDEFAEKFGRNWGGLIGSYRLEDADYVLVTIGATTGAARVVVDAWREKGVKMGLLKIRAVRPFPEEEIAEALKGRKAYGVIDRSVCFGWNRGIIAMETFAALGKAGVCLPGLSFVGGLGGLDLRTEYVDKAAGMIVEAAKGAIPAGETFWMNEDFL